MSSPSEVDPVGAVAGRQLLVLYGSQTGTAQDAAERVGREGKRRRFRVRILAMDDYNTVSEVIHCNPPIPLIKCGYHHTLSHIETHCRYIS